MMTTATSPPVVRDASAPETLPPGERPAPGESPSRAPAAPAGDRDAQGRFRTGNRGGPGNPFARQVAALRQALLNSVTAQDIQAVAGRLLELAKEGNVQAAKLLLAYTLGKPPPAADPDRVDLDEWRGYQETAGMLAESSALLEAPEPAFPLECVRLGRPAVTEKMRQTTAHALLHPEEIQRQEAQEAAACLRLLSQPAPQGFPFDDPSTNGSNPAGRKPAPRVRAAGPSPNGKSRRARPSTNGREST